MTNLPAGFPATRMRRLRAHSRLRDLLCETRLSVNDLIQPLFIKEGNKVCQPIAALPGQFQISVDMLSDRVADVVASGVPGVLLFGIPDHKDAQGSAACHPDGVVQRAVHTLKASYPELLVLADLCLCEYTDHGHCGVLTEHTGQLDVDNDATLDLLAKQAVSLAQAGVDVIAPSGMMDGMVGRIRQGLDKAGYSHTPILSYAVKYCSALYDPFRQAAEGAPRFMGRQTYQMNPANGAEALREVALDIAEGADILMVKPAHSYLDIIYRVKQAYPHVPLAAYHTSGEFAMIKAAAAQGWIEEQRVVLEVTTAIKRAGADFIITYFSQQIAAWIG